MAIWKLVPLDVHSPDWETSTHKGEVIVRAHNEDEARKCATREFVIATKVKVGEKIKSDPWNQPDVVSCERLQDSEYQEDGESKVLYSGGH